MKSIFERVIGQGSFDLTAMLARIDEYHIAGRLTDGERDELSAHARAAADASAGMDVPGEIQRLWAAIRALQAPSEDASVPAFRHPTGAHDAYYAGDRVRFGGMVYACIAPEGVACVWSPEVMPSCWQIS